jgi:hypothetical protein
MIHWSGTDKGFRREVELLTYLILAGLLLAYELLRRSAVAAWACFLVLPICLTPYWLGVNASYVDLFQWIKLYSVFLGACWVTAVRFTAIGHRPWAFHVLFLLLVINIAEAILKDCFSGTATHYLNAAAGLLLVRTLPSGLDTMAVDAHGAHRDLHWRIPLPWIVGYTIWNWVFLYAHYPQHAGSQTAVLASALIVGAIRPERWLQARAITFAVCLLGGLTFPSFFAVYANTAAWSSTEGQYVGALASLGFMMFYTRRALAQA